MVLFYLADRQYLRSALNILFGCNVNHFPCCGLPFIPGAPVQAQRLFGRWPLHACEK
jgi:hypothetical protein